MYYSISVAIILLCFTPGTAVSDDFTQQFDSDPVNTRFLRFIGPSKSGAITQTRRGLEIRLPDEQSGATQAGIATRFRLEGDFAVTLGYELVDVAKPETGYGAGIVLRLSRPEQSQVSVGLGRRMRRDGSDMINAVLSEQVDGRPKLNQKWFDAGADNGRLRIVRKGNVLQFLAAAGDREEFRELRQEEFDTEPVTAVFAMGDTGNSPDPIIVRLKYLTIEASSLSAGTSAKRQQRFWSVSTVMGVAGVIILVVCGIKYWRR